MTIEFLLKMMDLVFAVLIIVAVLLQPSQKTGLIGDATDIEKRQKRGFELFLFRATVILIILFISTALLFGAAEAGML